MRHLLPLLALAAAAPAAHAQMTGAAAAGDPHLRHPPARAATPADSARYAALVTLVRDSLARFRDVRVAEAAGFRRFAPHVKDQPVWHYVHRGWSIRAAFGFDPLRPPSLLYRDRPDGGLELVGVMYTAPRELPADSLDARVPLALAPWHLHVNICRPPWLAPARWAETQDGRPRFGPQSPIATRAACEAVGGRFMPSVFGWMVHVDAFAPPGAPAHVHRH